jgi:hypothetical protein
MPLRPQPGAEVIEQRFQQAGERGLVLAGQVIAVNGGARTTR